MTPVTAHMAGAKPRRSISHRRLGATSTPPHEAPVRARLRATPRRSTNHGATRMFTAARLMPDQATAIAAMAR